MNVGQKLYYVPSGNRPGQPYELEIVKIGRRWATVERVGATYKSQTRIDMDTMWADSGGFGTSPGRAYYSKEHYEDFLARDAAWRDLKNRMSWPVPDGLTLSDIRIFAARCKIPLQEKKS